VIERADSIVSPYKVSYVHLLLIDSPTSSLTLLPRTVEAMSTTSWERATLRLERHSTNCDHPNARAAL